MSVNIQNVLAGIAANVAARDAAKTAPPTSTAPPTTCPKCNEDVSEHKMVWVVKGVSGYQECPKEEQPQPEPRPIVEPNQATGMDVTDTPKATPPVSFFESIATPLIERLDVEVAPCYPGKKQIHTKLVPSPLTMKSKDPGQIHAWGAAEPNANVCVYAEQKEGGLLFLDKDWKFSLVEKYEKETGKKFPQTLLVQSSIVPDSNGELFQKGHWYFKQTPKTIALKKNITELETGGLFSLRVNNEYVASIGSIHPDTGQPYVIAQDNPVVPMPDDFLDWLLTHVTKPANGNGNGEVPEIKRDGAGLVPHGYIHAWALREAGILRNAGLEYDELEPILQRKVRDNCAPPIDTKKVTKMAESICKYPVGKAHGLLMEKDREGTPGANGTGVSEIPVIEDEFENDPRFEMNGDTFDTKVYEQLSHRSTPYPDPGDDDLVSVVAKAYVHGTNIPLAYCREPLKQMVLHALDGMLFHPAYPKLSLRGNHMNIAESDGGKTFGLEFALEAGRPILATNNIHSESLFRYKSETTFIRSFTPEGTVKRDAKGEIKSGSLGHPSQFLHVKEGNLIANCTDYFGSVFSRLTDLYDQTEAGTESMTNGDFTAKTAKVSVCMCFTPTDYQATFGGKGSIGSGGLNRWTISNPQRITYYDDKDWERLPAKTLEGLSTELAERVRQLAGGVRTILTEEPGAKEIRLRVKAMLKKVGKVGKRLMDYFVREQIVQAATAADGSLVMTTKQAEYAEHWVMAQLQARLDCWPSDAGNPIEGMEHAIRKAVSTHHVSESKLKDACNFYREGSGGWYVYRSALGNCIESGAVKQTGKTRKGFRTFCPGSCAVHPEVKEKEE